MSEETIIVLNHCSLSRYNLQHQIESPKIFELTVVDRWYESQTSSSASWTKECDSCIALWGNRRGMNETFSQRCVWQEVQKIRNITHVETGMKNYTNCTLGNSINTTCTSTTTNATGNCSCITTSIEYIHFNDTFCNKTWYPEPDISLDQCKLRCTDWDGCFGINFRLRENDVGTCELLPSPVVENIPSQDRSELFFSGRFRNVKYRY